MNKFNKKGFTLIEMLVVIAIIAVLVSIIIPIVGNSTAKAQAATDAANLRSAKATITIAVLDGRCPTPCTDASTYAGGVPATSKSSDGGAFSASVDNYGNVTVKYGSLGIDDFAQKAGGTASGNAGGNGNGGGGDTQTCECTVGDTAGCCANPQKSSYSKRCTNCYNDYKAAATCVCTHSHAAGVVCGQ